MTAGALASSTFGSASGQGWQQVGDLALAFVLSALIGLERQTRQKSAGLRTHTVVGVAAALIMLVSKYGFSDVLGSSVVLDPSRVAAQIVSGIGFIGGGLIFVRRDAVRGLTTAAVVWLTTAVGMAAGAGLPVLAVLVTFGHYLIIYGFTPLVPRISRSRLAASQVRLIYRDGSGALRRALVLCTRLGFSVTEVEVQRAGTESTERGRDDRRDRDTSGRDYGSASVSVVLTVLGSSPVTELVTGLVDIDGILSASGGDEAD